MNKGFSTVEILIAFALLIMALSGILIVVFGNDSFAIDSQLNGEALFFAEQELNKARAAAETNFVSFFGFLGEEDEKSDGTFRYQTEVSVTDLTPCKKELQSTVSWSPTPLRDQFVRLVSQVVSIEELEALGDDCADEATDDWKDPSSLVAVDFAPSGIPSTDIDVADGYAYITSNSDSQNHSDFWIFDVHDPEDTGSVIIVGSLNTDTDPKAKKPFGLNAVDVAGNYAYVARNASTSQLMVIDVSSKTNPAIVAERSLPDVHSSFPEGRSIFFRENYIYIGTHETEGNEFHVYDVGNDAGCIPTNPCWRGSRQINNNVHDITVRDEYAFIATSGDARELQVLDVSNPGNLTVVTQFNVGGTEKNDADGKAIYIIGNKIYLGRDYKKDSHNFYIIDISNPLAPSLLGSKEMPLKNDEEIVGIVVTGNLGFLSTTNTNDTFQIWDISEPTNITRWTSCIFKYPAKPAGLDFDGEYAYVANESQNAMRVIWNDPANSCKN